jgi:hypothetical protein
VALHGADVSAGDKLKQQFSMWLRGGCDGMTHRSESLGSIQAAHGARPAHGDHEEVWGIYEAC